MMNVDLLIFFAFIMILFSYFQGRVIFCVSPEIAVMQGTTLCAGENRGDAFSHPLRRRFARLVGGY